MLAREEVQDGEAGTRCASDGGAANAANAAAAAAAGARGCRYGGGRRRIRMVDPGRSPTRASPASDTEAAGAPSLGCGHEVRYQPPHARELQRAGWIGDATAVPQSGRAKAVRPLLSCSSHADSRRLRPRRNLRRRLRRAPSLSTSQSAWHSAASRALAAVAACAALQTTEAKYSHLLGKVGRFLMPHPPTAGSSIDHQYGKMTRAACSTSGSSTIMAAYSRG